ncbi:MULTISPECIES: metallophosphoesterase [Amycolatopsis]|uniref:Metallophosphoesterase n=1 Tax=Amycolatopsis dendrobii TaxID=2760662 RepID=A0A7W3ZA33_9PSEU|nr:MULTISPECIES: metallophosphoesterase [Amycolatopsis]MBB1154046.1 metallophosphoesterase [Amycolatopsis dendrobii]UKD51574.1 metallophosphoesterase [Amycolatopsis sp. FU40]
MVGVRRVAFVVAAVLLLFGEPWSVLVLLPDWPVAATVSGTVVFAVAALSFPVLMVLGHGPKQNDAAARIGDVTLGTVWVLFTWSVLTHLLRLVLLVSGVDDPARPRIVAAVTLAVAAVLLVSGNRIAMRVPPVKPVDVVLPKLGPGLDGLRVAVITDTHYGPLDRTRWSERLVAELNRLQPDVVCHAGDLADGSVAKRRKQVDPLGGVQAPLGRFYITGNHEYFGEAQAWLDHMASLGWDTLHNRSTLLERDGARLLFAGIDDPTGAASGLPGHGPDLAAALDGSDPDVPVVLLAHQPKQVAQAREENVDLQISGHTHGGQIWPFHLLVRLDQPTLSGLTRHGPTQLYNSRGSGFWGPPFRVFAPNEIALLTLHSA